MEEDGGARAAQETELAGDKLSVFHGDKVSLKSIILRISVSISHASLNLVWLKWHIRSGLHNTAVNSVHYYSDWQIKPRICPTGLVLGGIYRYERYIAVPERYAAALANSAVYCQLV